MSNVFSKLRDILFSVTASQLIAGMLGAVLVLGVTHFTEIRPQCIATVNITSLVNQFVQSQVKLNLPPKELQKRVNTFGHELQAALDQVAKKQHVVLMMQEAVVAGTSDLTPLVRQQLTQLSK